MKEYTEAQALNELRKKGVSWSDGAIIIQSGSMGIRMLGYVDYLVNHLKYRVIFRHDSRGK